MNNAALAILVLFPATSQFATTPFYDYEALRGVSQFQVGVWSTIAFDNAGVSDSGTANYVRGRLRSAGIKVVDGYSNRTDAADIFIYIRGDHCCGSGLTGTVGFTVSQFCTVNENGEVLQVATVRDDKWICCLASERVEDYVREEVKYLVDRFIESYKEANSEK